MVRSWLGAGVGRGEVVAEGGVGLAGDVALEAADDLGLGLASRRCGVGVGAGARAVAQATDGDQVQGARLALAVAAVVEAVAGRLAGGGGDRAGAAERGERGLAAEPVDVLSGGDEELAGVAGRDPEQLVVRGAAGANELLELSVENGDLIVESVDPSGDRAQRELRCVGKVAELAWCRAQPAAEGGLAAERLAAGELVAELLRGGDDQVAELDDRGAAGLHGAVARGAQQPDRLDDPVGLLRDRLGLAGQEQPGGHLGVDRVALADPTTRVRVRLVDLDDPNVVLAQIAHERRGIGAGRLDRDHVDLAESAQPVQQLGGSPASWSGSSSSRAALRAHPARRRDGCRRARQPRRRQACPPASCCACRPFGPEGRSGREGRTEQ